MSNSLKAGIRGAAILLLLFAAATLLNADGGVVQFRKQAGPFTVSLFTSPSPLRAGQADMSILLESAQSRVPILDASVSLELRNQRGREITIAATRQQATNKLLYAALPAIPEPGTWDVEVTIAQGSHRATVTGTIQVLPSAPVIVHYWPYFAVVPCGIGLFILNQFLKGKQRARRA